jgi:hypothetical protein
MLRYNREAAQRLCPSERSERLKRFVMHKFLRTLTLHYRCGPLVCCFGWPTSEGP